MKNEAPIFDCNVGEKITGYKLNIRAQKMKT